jgi:hypothetical protein
LWGYLRVCPGYPVDGFTGVFSRERVGEKRKVTFKGEKRTDLLRPDTVPQPNWDRWYRIPAKCRFRTVQGPRPLFGNTARSRCPWWCSFPNRRYPRVEAFAPGAGANSVFPRWANAFPGGSSHSSPSKVSRWQIKKIDELPKVYSASMKIRGMIRDRPRFCYKSRIPRDRFPSTVSATRCDCSSGNWRDKLNCDAPPPPPPCPGNAVYPRRPRRSPVATKGEVIKRAGKLDSRGLTMFEV